MVADIATTNYAISNDIGYEGNTLMFGIASNLFYLILVKLIGSMVIIMLMKKIIEKNENAAKIGMRIIVFMMLFVVANNIMIINASALVFQNFSGDAVAGSVNTGNGYFDDEQDIFGYTGDRNVYIVGEVSEIWLFEPTSYSSGGTAYKLIDSSLGTIKDAVVHNGYIYFVDDTTLKKKKSRNVAAVCESTDTSPGGCISIIDTGVAPTLRVHDNKLYYIIGSNLRHLDDDDNGVADFSVGTAIGGTHLGFTVASNSTGTLAYVAGTFFVGTDFGVCSTLGCTQLITYGGEGKYTQYVSAYTKSTTIYKYTYPTAVHPPDGRGFYISNNTGYGETVITTNIQKINRAYVGGLSTIGLWADSTTYITFNSNEIGTGSLPTFPADITYTKKGITSNSLTYYNMSNIYIIYEIEAETILTNTFIDFEDYAWQIDLVDPNNVAVNTYTTPQCDISFTIFFDFNCRVNELKSYSPPANGWMQGNWKLKLYEVNQLTNIRALLTTSSTFEVLNTTLENQSIPTNPTTPPSSGTGAISLKKIDNFTALFGLGVNSISKFAFAMMWIVIALFFGFLASKNNINGGIAVAILPFSFFIFIEYLPLWTVVIVTMIVGMKLFR